MAAHIAPLAQVSSSKLTRNAKTSINSSIQPITLKLSGKVIKNRMYRTPLSEYASTYDEENVENCGKPMPRYAELYQGSTNSPPRTEIIVDSTGS